MLRTKEHYDLMTAFERDAHGRVDREPKELWVRGNIYQDGHVNEAFRAYRAGYAYGRFSAQMDSRDEIDALKADLANLEFLLQHVIGDHCAPNDCYATGPLTGDPIADLISCPSCSALDYLAGKEKK